MHFIKRIVFTTAITDVISIRPRFIPFVVSKRMWVCVGKNILFLDMTYSQSFFNIFVERSGILKWGRIEMTSFIDNFFLFHKIHQFFMYCPDIEKLKRITKLPMILDEMNLLFFPNRLSIKATISKVSLFNSHAVNRSNLWGKQC